MWFALHIFPYIPSYLIHPYIKHPLGIITELLHVFFSVLLLTIFGFANALH